MKKFCQMGFLGLFLLGCSSTSKESQEEAEINLLLNNLNQYAAEANYTKYFECFSEQSTFMGTDATEKWKKKEFMVWAKPFFNRGRAWSFKSVKRSLYMDSELPIAWFDELLSTQMKICRGSGVVAKEKNGWKIKQYVLSMTIPNTFSDSVVNIKAAVEDSLLQSFQQRK